MSAEGDVNPKAYPLADAKLTKDILELVHGAQNYVSLPHRAATRICKHSSSSSDNYAKVPTKRRKPSIAAKQN